MTQLHLFQPRVEALPGRQPDLVYIRKSLNRLLRMAQEAHIMPWSVSETESLERLFSQLAASLPADEAQNLTSEFESELARLRSGR